MKLSTIHFSNYLAISLLMASCMSSTFAFQMQTPYHVPWVAVIENFDITNCNEEELKLLCEDCFQKCPVMVFKNQSPKTTTSKDFFDFCTKFDPDVDWDAIKAGKVLHPFRQEPDAPHVAIREEKNDANKNELGDQFRFGPVWHMDLVGSKNTEIPNVVSAFHFLQCPQVGGETIFSNMDMAYASLPPELKKKVDSLVCVYDNDLGSLFNFKLDADGFTRLGPFPKPGQEDQISRPLISRDAATGRKRMFFTPVRFNHFEGMSREESWEFMTYLFHTYINTPRNTVSIRWEEGDVAIFKNHAMIHTSTPWEIYKGKKRRFRLMFLNSKKMDEPHTAAFVDSVKLANGDKNMNGEKDGKKVVTGDD